MIQLKEKSKIVIIFILLAIASFLTYYFHIVLRTGIVFTHFFYIPIIVASLWWKRKGLVVVIFLAALLFLSDFYANSVPSYDDIPRIFMFMVVGLLVAFLSETIVKGDELVSVRSSELRESETKYRTLYESSSDAIMLLDEEGFFDCNNATLQIFGFLKKDDFIKVHPADVSPPYQPDGADSLTAANNKISEAFSKGMNKFEWMHRRKNGEDFPAEVLLTAFLFNGKQVLQATVRDITERKKIEESLRFSRDEAQSANMAKANFLHTMSHELRTPLNAVLGFSEMLKLRTFGELNEKQEHAIDNIIAGSNNLHNIIGQVLDIIKMDEGTLGLNIEKIPVLETVDEVIGIIKEKATKKNVLLEKNLDPQLEHIFADRQKFKQVFINLLDNAVKFSKDEGGTVTIKSKKESDMAKFSVSDRGIGIKENDIEKIFQNFNQLDSGMSRKYGGTGIGLTITRKLVELQGGRIWVESKYGEGSTFAFTLPIGSRSQKIDSNISTVSTDKV